MFLRSPNVSIGDLHVDDRRSQVVQVGLFLPLSA